MEKIEKMAAILRAKNEKQRSAWGRGVGEYAAELLEEIESGISGGWVKPDALDTRDALESAALNGARDWSAYSLGGCSLIYDGDIAARLCAPWELKRTHGGERRPNGSEEWLDVQARALRQAFGLLWDVARGAK